MTRYITFNMERIFKVSFFVVFLLVCGVCAHKIVYKNENTAGKEIEENDLETVTRMMQDISVG